MFIPIALGKVVPHGPGKWKANISLAGSSFKLNSATGFPFSATSGANIAAGYTTEEVPMTRHMSQVSIASPKMNNVSYNSISVF